MDLCHLNPHTDALIVSADHFCISIDTDGTHMAEELCGDFVKRERCKEILQVVDPQCLRDLVNQFCLKRKKKGKVQHG